MFKKLRKLQPLGHCNIISGPTCMCKGPQTREKTHNNTVKIPKTHTYNLQNNAGLIPNKYCKSNMMQ